jgi:hypothetical protein
MTTAGMSEGGYFLSNSSKTCSFTLKILTETEKRYSTIDTNPLGIVRAVKHYFQSFYRVTRAFRY